MAQDGATSEATAVATSDVAQRMGVSVDYAQKYRRRLIDSGVIRPAGRGKVAFAVPLLAAYLQRRLDNGI